MNASRVLLHFSFFRLPEKTSVVIKFLSAITFDNVTYKWDSENLNFIWIYM